MYDHTTLVYDWYLAPGRYLCGIGPPPLNLERDVFPIRAAVVGRCGRRANLGPVRISRPDDVLDKVWLYSFPVRRVPEENPEIILRFGNAFETCIRPRPWSRRQRGIGIAAIQKDNPPAWIVDWVRYHASLGCNHVMIYDNGSRDQAELATLLEHRNLPCNITLVDWPFPYGLHRSFQTTFAQWGALNHAYAAMRWGSWLANFDIDEYVVADDPRVQLPALLRQLPKRAGVAIARQYRVPPLIEPQHELPPVSDRRAEEFILRDREPVKGLWKYLVRRGAARVLRVHRVRLRRPFRTVRPDRLGLSYLHFDALNTNWKGEDRDDSPRSRGDLVEDRRVQARMHR